MTPHPVHVDEVGDLHLLDGHRRIAVDGVDVLVPFDRGVGHAESGEQVLVEPVRTQQQLVDLLQEEP